MSQSQGAAAAQHAPPLKFAALRHPGYRVYFVTTALAMMADNIEHVISYWVIFEKFQSPELGGFRHSDTVLITESGIEILTYYPRDLENLTISGQ